MRVLILIATAITGLACASDTREGGAATSRAHSDAPAGSALAKIEVGMSDAEVRELIGEPDEGHAYMTGKAWRPFYWGSDTHRTDWMYRGEGRVVFSGSRGALEVIHVLYDPDELE